MITIFSYTVIQHEYYKKVADSQQKRIMQNPTSRGNILSSSESLGGVLAVSTNLGTLAIDPTQSGSRDKLLRFLSDLVFEEFCSHTKSECIEDISSYLRENLQDQKDLTESIMKEKIRNYLSLKMDSPIESVDIASNLSEETIAIIESWQDPALFFVVNNLYVNPTKVQNASILAAQLSTLLSVPVEIINQKFAIKKRKHLEIIRKMSISVRDMVNKRMETELLAFKNKQINSTDMVSPFLKIEDNLIRYYPEWHTIGQITGFVDGEGKGKYWIEGYFDGNLQTENPTQTVVTDIAGRPIRDYISDTPLTLKSGVDITLTIDRNIQKEISKRLKESVAKLRANSASVVVMNPKTGAIIAMVNYPDFDPNSFTDVYDMEPVMYSQYPNPSFDLFGFPLFVVDTLSGTLLSTIEGKRMKFRQATEPEIANFAIMKYKFKNGFWVGNYKNDVIGSLYEPGSVFKAFTVAIGLDTGEIKPDDTYFDRGRVELDIGGGVKRTISNVSSTCMGRHTFLHSLNWSCNVGMINIVERVWKSLFHQYLHDFGFSSRTNITMDWETYSQISPYEKWSRMQFFTMSFGQWITATMLQMATAYSVLANGGVYMQPYIIESMSYPNGKKVETLPTPLRRVIKDETSKTITAMLVNGVQNGFARDGSVPWYTIAGKTGTSQIPSKGRYEEGGPGHTITSFWWYAPAYNPKFVLIVRIDRPRTSEWSEYTSSPLFANIAKYLLEYYEVPKND